MTDARIQALDAKIEAFERRHPYATADAVYLRLEKEMWAEIAASEAREYRIQHWGAVWMLLTTRQDDLCAPYCSWLRMVALKVLCVIAMALGRDDRSRYGGYALRHSLQCGFWGLLDGGYGGGEVWWQLDFSWREFRYSLNREVGECSW